MKTPTRFYLFVSGILLVTMLLSYSTVDPVSRALADEGRPVELKLDVAPASQGSQTSPADLLSPDDAVVLELDDSTVENGVGINGNTSPYPSYQIIWLNRFTPDSSLYPFTLNQISVFFSPTAASGVSADDAIDLVVYLDADGDPSNGATLLATFETSVVAVDGTLSTYDLATPVEISGPGDVLIGVIDRFVVSGVTGPTYPAAIDTTASQGRSWIGWWSSDPPDPASLPPDNTFVTIDSLGLPGNWIIRGAGVTGSGSEVYLPLVVKNLGPPAAPALNAISNEDGDGTYTVRWSSVSGASNYVLEEDDNASFSSPTPVYDNSGTSTGISGRDVGTYFYRVRAENSSGISDWSGTQSVAVTVEPPDCPQLGGWTGTNDRSRAISYDVINTSGCEVDDLTISLLVYCSGGTSFSGTTTFFGSDPVVNNQFDTGSGGSYRVQGTFSSSTTASGTWSYNGANPYSPTNYCNDSGTWTASWKTNP